MKRKQKDDWRKRVDIATLNYAQKKFLIFEGSKTEVLYFDEFSSAPIFSKKNSIELIQFEREKFEECNSHINWLITSTNFIFKNNNGIKEKIYGFFSWMNSLDYPLSLNDIIDFINLYSLNDATELEIFDQLRKEYKMKEQWDKYSLYKDTLYDETASYDEKDDEIYIIIDRDKETVFLEQYNIAVEQCKNYNYKLIVTNPCFEFWLLLHLAPRLSKAQKSLLLENEGHGNKSYSYKLLKEYDKNYTKNNFDFNFYEDKIISALKNLENYKQDLESLKDELGSNMNELIGPLILK